MHIDTTLTIRAQARAQYFCTHPLSHERWIYSFHGINYNFAGENLDQNFTTGVDAFNALMESPAHRTNIMNPHFTNIGLGRACGVDVTLFTGV